MYNIEAGQREPVGGAARLAALCAAERARAGSDRSLVAFGGDAFNPSLASVFTRGEHMVPVLNAIGVNVAVVGNHDLDFGVEALAQHMGNCTFPWLLANVVDKASGKPLAGAAPTHVLEKGGVKVSVMIQSQEACCVCNATAAAAAPAPAPATSTTLRCTPHCTCLHTPPPPLLES